MNELRLFFEKYMADPIVVPAILKPQRQIVRARLNEKEEIYSEVKKISYPKEFGTISGRVSLLKESTFYGTYVDRVENIHMSIDTAIKEICPAYCNPDFIGTKIITIGYWESTKEILLYALPIPPTYNGENHEIVDDIRKKWNNCRENFPLKDIELVEFIGELMCQRGNSSYNITSAFAQHLFEKNPNLQGVLYPSVDNDGQNMCIALKSSAVDDSFIQCTSAKLFFYARMSSSKNLLQSVAMAPVKKNASDEFVLGWEPIIYNSTIH